MTDDSAAGAEIQRRDELLQLLYWMEGEGFASDATVTGVCRFLDASEAGVARTLEGLVRRGDVVTSEREGEPVRYRLTDIGRREAARRFAEEFAGMQHKGHGECEDPDCECHTSPEAAAECRADSQLSHSE